MIRYKEKEERERGRAEGRGIGNCVNNGRKTIIKNRLKTWPFRLTKLPRFLLIDLI